MQSDPGIQYFGEEGTNKLAIGMQSKPYYF